MKKYFLLFGFVSMLFLSCSKTNYNANTCAYVSSNTVAPATEIAALQAYITANHPAAIQASSGFFYEIGNAGSGTITPAVCSTITATYTGKLVNGITFDSNLTGYSSVLGQLILGWQFGLPLIKKGGSINLYIPPTLGYGSQNITNSSGVVIVPANSILIFTIQLTDVQ